MLQCIRIDIFKNKREKKRKQEVKISQGKEIWQKEDYSYKCFLEVITYLEELQEQNIPKC